MSDDLSRLSLMEHTDLLQRKITADRLAIRPGHAQACVINLILQGL